MLESNGLIFTISLQSKTASCACELGSDKKRGAIEKVGNRWTKAGHIAFTGILR